MGVLIKGLHKDPLKNIPCEYPANTPVPAFRSGAARAL